MTRSTSGRCNGRQHPRRIASRLLAAALVFSPILVGCGDGTPAFCEQLAENAELDDLSGALERGDLAGASSEADRLVELVSDAPPEVRSDLTALTEAIGDIIELLSDEADDSAPAGEIERRTDELNERFSDLDVRSERVSTWAERECGIRLL